MRFFPLCLVALLPLTGRAAVSDTSRVYNIEEAVVVASPKETAFLRSQPISAGLLGAADLQAIGATTLSDLSTATPNFYMPSYGSRVTSAAYVRGVGSRIGAPAVGLYVDNVPYLERSAFDFSFIDVDRVDLLRGPQSTLYGGGAMGGVVRVFTADPFRHKGLQAELGATTRNSGRRVKAVAYLHPSDKVALSVGGFYTGDEGFYRNAYSGQKADAEDAAGGKLRLGWRPAENLRMDLTAQYEYSDERACPYFLMGAVRNGVLTDEAWTDSIGQNRQSRYRRSLLNVAMGWTWQAPRLTLSSITAYRYLRDRLFMDQDFRHEDIFSLTQRQRMSGVTQEITLKNRTAGRWQWVSGAYFRYQGEHTACPVRFHKEGVDYLNANFARVLPARPSMTLAFTTDELCFTSAMETPSTGAALFHQSTVQLGAGLSLTGGLRLEYDHRSLDLDSEISPAAQYQFAMPSFRIDQAFAATAGVGGRLSADTWQLLPKVALQYDHRSGRGNVYVSVSKGYRPGGYNLQSYSELSQQALQREMMQQVKDFSIETIQAMPLPESSKQGAIAGMTAALDPHIPAAPRLENLYYKPEEAWNYELGGHLGFAGGALTVDYTLFCVETRNRQLARFAESGLGRITVNAGRSRSLGAEITVRSALLDNRLQLTAAYGYTHAELTHHYLGEQDGTPVDYSGNRVPFAPEHTLYADAAFRQPLAGKCCRAVSVGVNTSAAGRIYWDEANSYSQPFYAVLNARLGVELGESVEVELRGHNLTATRYAVFAFDSMGHRFEQVGLPRHFEATVRLSF